ncbi:tetratricopeptide repeat protein, partial [bacterium]|nr:tetratricopeptide repeat protein [bacterium]
PLFLYIKILGRVIMQFMNISTPRHPEVIDEHIGHFTGKNHRYFLYKWKFSGWFAQWNWTAFFLGPFWLIYRKNYFWAFFFASSYLVFDFVFTSSPYFFTFSIELMILSGLFANNIYHAKLSRIQKGFIKNKTSMDSQLKILKTLGGTQWRLPAMLFPAMLLLTFVIPSLFGIHLLRSRVKRLDITSAIYAVFPPHLQWREIKLLRLDYQTAYLQGYFHKSIALNENTLKLSAWKFGPNHAYTIALQSELISNKLNMGDYQDAHRLTTELLKYYQLKFGRNHLFYIFMKNNLAANYIYQGLYSRAKTECHNCLLDLAKYTPDTDTHPVILSNLAQTYSNMGFIYQVYCQYEAAKKYHIEALAFAVKAANGYNIHTCPYLERLGDFYKEQLQIDQAETLYLQAKNIAEQALGLENALVASLLLKLGELNYLKHQFFQAEIFIRQAYMINTKYFGYNHTATAEATCQLGRILFAQGKVHQAETHLNQSLKITTNAIGQNNAVYAKYLNHMAGLYIFRNDYSTAEKTLLISLDRSAAIYGANNPRLLIPLEQLSLLYKKTNNTPACRGIVRRIQRIRQGTPPQQTPSKEIFILDPSGLMI